MNKALNEDERKEMLARISEAHGQVVAAVSDLRRRYAPKAAVIKAAVKAERDLFVLRRELEKLEGAQTPERESLPEVRRGGNVIDIGEQGGGWKNRS